MHSRYQSALTHAANAGNIHRKGFVETPIARIPRTPRGARAIIASQRGASTMRAPWRPGACTGPVDFLIYNQN